MDEALIKPQKVRRVANIQPPPAGVEADFSAQGTLVEVADPRALRPRDFRTDFVYRPTSTAEDLALCELPPLLESVLSGTDALLLVCGPAGAEQAELLDGPSGISARAVGQLAVELQARQARHRSGGSGGYSFFMKLHVFEVLGDRIEDLLTDQPEATRLTDTPLGVVVEGLRSTSVAVPEEAVKVLEQARRRQDPSHRGKAGTVVEVQVTQADYFAGWGLFGRLLLVEAPAMDCLAEDRGLVQLRDGFDTFRGVYHLRNLVHTWQPRQPGDVNGSALTWLLREMLCGGSISATVLLCLKQQQPSVSLALLEFLDAFGKVETNPVCCDHRVAGLTRAMRAECLAKKGPASAGGLGDRAGGEDARRIILELEKRLKGAERSRDDAMRNEELKQHKAVDFRERYAGAIQGQESMHDRLVTSEEEHMRACEAMVGAQMECTEAKEELSEVQYKDNLMLMVLEQEVVDIQASEKQFHSVVEKLEAELHASVDQRTDLERHLELAAAEAESRAEAISMSEGAAQGQVTALQAAQKRAEDLRLSLDAAVEARVSREIEVGNLENRLESLKVDYQKGALDASRTRDEEARDAQAKLVGPQRDLQDLRRSVSQLQDEVKLEAAAERQAREAGSEASAELLRLREDFHRSLAGLAVAPSDKGGESASSDDGAAGGVGAARARLEALGKEGREREQKLQEECSRLQGHTRELQRRLAWSSRVALDWAPAEGSCEADKGRLRGVLDDAQTQASASAEAGAGLEREARQRCEALRLELERERQKLSVAQAEASREARRQDVELKRLHAELLELQGGGGGLPMASIQRQLLSEVEALRGGGGGGAGEERRLREENEALKAKLGRLERQMPGDQRAQLQRVAFLERSSRGLEAERSELLVRATVAEEQLLQLQKYLKEMTEGYQMQILQLKLQARAQ